MFPNIDLRPAYERAQKLFPNSIISRQTLRIEEALNPMQSQYKFQTKQGNSSTDGPLENLLTDTDAFVLIGAALGVKKQDTSTTPPRYGNYQIFYFPDTDVFVGAPASQATEAQSLMTIYNGKLSFSTGSLQRIRETDTQDFLMVSQDRSTNDAYQVKGGFYIPYVAFQPTILIDGAQNNEFQLTLGSGDITGIDGSYTSGGAHSATSRNILVLTLIGLNIANGSAAAKQLVNSWGY